MLTALFLTLATIGAEPAKAPLAVKAIAPSDPFAAKVQTITYRRMPVGPLLPAYSTSRTVKATKTTTETYEARGRRFHLFQRIRGWIKRG